MFVDLTGRHLDDKSTWESCHDWLTFTVAKMEAVFGPLIRPLQPADLLVSSEIETLPAVLA